MAVTNLRFNITSSWDGGGLRSASRALSDVDRDSRRMNRSLGRGLSGMLTWRNAAIALAPAMFTLGKHALALAGGLATLGAVTAAAAAPWIGLAITAAKNADKMGAAGASYEKATGRVKNAWMDLAKKTAPLTLQPMTDVLEGVAKAIPKLEPLVRDIAPVFGQMGRDIRDWLSGAGFERFLGNLRDVGVPAFRNLVAAGRDFLGTVGIGFRAFLPLALDISEAIEKGASNLHSWAIQGGFDRFVAGVRREWPTVKRFLTEAGESIGKIKDTFDKMGPGQLRGISNVLEQFNKVNLDGWRAFLLTMAGLRIAGGLLSLISGLASIRGGQLSITGGAALLTAAGALTAAGGILASAAAALSGAAGALASAGASAALGGLGALIGGLLGRLAGGSVTFTVNISPADAPARLERIRSVFNGLRGQTATMTVTLNAGAFTGAVNGVISHWQMVRAAAAVPAIFRAMAIPGNVPAVAAMIIAAWARVRAASFAIPVFKAIAIPGNVPAVAAIIIVSWRRVLAMPRSWTATARVNGGAAVSGANRVRAAWQRVLGMPRSWSATARVNAGAAVSGANAARAAWSSVLSMPRSVTFTVTIKTKKVGNSEGGPPIPVPHLAGGGKVFGPGGPRSDRVPAMLSRGEWVIRAAAVKELGTDFLAWVNSAGPGSSVGGSGGSAPAAASTGRSGGGGSTHVHFHGSVYAKSQVDFENMLASAMQEMKRKGRL